MSPWAKLDDSYPEHRKVLQVGSPGMAMHTSAICYANRQLTDGFIPAAMVPRLTDFENWREIVQSLVDAVLFEPADGGYQVHDFLDYNPSKAEVLRLREDRARAGSIGGKRSWDARRSKAEAPPEANASANGQSTGEANSEANALAPAKPVAKANSNPVPVPVPVPVPTPEPEPTQDSLGADAPMRPKYSANFEIFWQEEWNVGISKGRGAKSPAFDAWKRLGLERGGAAEDRQAVIDGLRRWKRSSTWQSDGGRFIPHAHRWLKERRWESDPPDEFVGAPSKVISALEYAQRLREQGR